MVCRPATEGDKATRIYGLSQDARIGIGRAPDNGIIYDSPYASSHHATLLFAARRFSVMDPGSPNGVFVNGRRIKSAPLRDADMIRIGTTELEFQNLEQ